MKPNDKMTLTFIAIGGMSGLLAGIFRHWKEKMDEEETGGNDLPDVKEGKVAFVNGQKPEKGFLVIPKNEDPADILNEVKDAAEDIGKVVVPNVNGGVTLEEVSEAFHRYANIEVDIPEVEDVLVVEKSEYMALPVEDRHVATYFVLDDILAGFDERLDEIPADSQLYQVGVNALMANDWDGVFVIADGVGYEIVRSSGNYLEELLIAGGKEDDDV